MTKDRKGVIYTWRECGKKILWICNRWDLKYHVFKFEDEAAMGWFSANDFGFMKRPSP
jgi:hypothetical protein